MTDSENRFIPTILTERPIKGPLSSLFEKESVTSEQKFCMICGILDAIRFIHKKGFVHLNLNPSTIYIDENLQVKVCDYIFVPPFDISVEELEYDDDDDDDDDDDEKSFKLTISKKTDQAEFYKDGLYTAPEIIEGNQNVNELADIYSAGLIIFFILFEKDPTFSNGLIEYPPEIDNKWKDIINECINHDISLRPRAKSIFYSLLDDKKKLEFISSITMNPQTTPISLRTKTYLLSLIEKKIVIRISSEIIQNFSKIDEQTLLIIQAAEKGDIESLEIVGTYFLNGEHGLDRDEELAFSCFKVAADKGSVKSMIKLAEMNENGIGCNQSFQKASFFYRKAYDKMNNTDPERSRIETKFKEIDEKSRSIQIETLSDQMTSEKIKSLLNLKCPFDITQLNENMFKLTFEKTMYLRKSISILKRGERNKTFKILNQENNKNSNNNHQYEPPLPRINIDDYYQGEENNRYIKLASGSFSNCYLVYDKKTQIPYLAKVFRHDSMKYMRKEILTTSLLNHPTLIKYIGYSEYDITQKVDQAVKSQWPTLLSEFIPRCTLEKMIESQYESWTSTSKLKIIIGIVCGMTELYLHNIIHRDLKTENISLNENYEPVITGFETSRQNDIFQKTQKVGTPIYMAPELFVYYNSFYNYKVDSYSFGIILYQILTGTSAPEIFPDKMTEIFELKMDNYLPNNISDMNPIFVYIIKSCWNVSIDARLDALTIYNILIEAVRKREQILPDIDFESVDEYIKRLENKEQKPPPKDSKPIQIHYEFHADTENELNEEELKKIESLNIKKIDLEEYKIIRELGSGGFAKVFLIKDNKTGQEYAAKQYSFDSKNDKEDFMQELTIHSELNHPLIPKIVGYSMTDFNQERGMLIIMEYVKNGSLERILKAEINNVTIDEWNETMKLITIYGIASAILHMHKHNIVHLDIKPSNTLIDDFIFPKTCDFSISTKIGDGNKKVEVRGTVPFIAPEFCGKSNYSFKSDVYSFGVLLYIMKYKQVPFENCDIYQYYNQVGKFKKRPRLNNSVPKVYRNLIKSCWDDDPDKRPTFDFIVNELEHNKEFITNGVDESLYKAFIDAVKSEFQNEKLMKNFPPKNLEELYRIKKSEIIDDPSMLDVNYEYLENTFCQDFGDFEDFEEIRVIDEDPESTTSEYQNKKTGRLCTITTLNIPIESIEEAKKETEKLFKIKHPTIEEFYGFKTEKNQENSMLFSESYPFKTLKEIIDNERKGKHDFKWTNTNKKINIYGIAVGMKYLHEQGIHHPTLNPKNIHVDSNYQPKLSGIGIYTQPQNSQIFSKFTSSGINEKYYYFSPEYLRGRENVTEKSDVYSFGVVVYEILTNKKPYGPNNTNGKEDNAFEFMSKKEQGEYQPIFEENMPVFFKELIHKCMSQNQEERPSFSFIVEKLENDLSFIQDDIDEISFNNYKKFIQNS